MRVSPGTILAIKNPLVARECGRWMNGEISWEQALMNAIVSLDVNNAYLMTLNRESLARIHMPIVEAAREALALNEEEHAQPAPPVARDLTASNRIQFFEKHGCWPEDPKAKEIAP